MSSNEHSPAVDITATPPVATRGVRTLCLMSLLILAVFLGIIGKRAISNHDPDFEYFYSAGHYLLNYGDLDRGVVYLPDGRIELRGTIEWYLPCVSRFMTLLAWLPFEAAGYIWLGMNLIVFVTTITLLGRHLTGLPPQDWPVTLLLPVLMLALFWYWEFRLNQIDNLTLLLIVGSFVLWQTEYKKSAGFWLGLAVLLKVTPALLVIWFVLKREFKTVGFALLTIVLAGPLADLIVFRQGYTVDLYQKWFQTAAVRGSQRGLILAQREMDWRNQSLGAVASRWLARTNYALHFDNDPRIKTGKQPATMNVANLSRPQIATIVLSISGLSLGALIWITRRPARYLNCWQLRGEWALFLLTMLWMMPVLRRYHLILLLPPLTVLAAAIHYAGPRRAWTKVALACAYGVVLCQLLVLTRVLPEAGMLKWLDGILGAALAAELSRTFDAGIVEAAGVLLLTVILLAIPLLALLRQLAKRPDTLPQPGYRPASVNGRILHKIDRTNHGA